MLYSNVLWAEFATQHQFRSRFVPLSTLPMQRDLAQDKEGNYITTNIEASILISWDRCSVILMLTKAAEVLSRPDYLDAALIAGDVVWERGCFKLPHFFYRFLKVLENYRAHSENDFPC